MRITRDERRLDSTVRSALHSLSPTACKIETARERSRRIPVGDGLVLRPFGPLLPRAQGYLLLFRLVDLETEHARHVLARRGRRAQLTVGLKEQVRKGRAEECAVNIVATGHVVVVELLALGAKQLHRVLSTERCRVRHPRRKYCLLLAERARARAEL